MPRSKADPLIKNILDQIEFRRINYGYVPLCEQCENECKVVNAFGLRFFCYNFQEQTSNMLDTQ